MSKTQDKVRQTLRESVSRGSLVVGWDYWNCLGLMRSHPVEPLADVGKLALALPLDNDPELRERFVAFCNTKNIRDRKSFLAAAAQEFGTTVPAHGLSELNRIIDIELGCSTVFNDVKPVLRALVAANIPQGIISNMWTFPIEHLFGSRGDDPQCNCGLPVQQYHHLLPSLELGKFFKHIVLSCEVGYAKPDLRIFLEFCRRFGVRPEDVLFVGDSISSDIEGALAAGMMVALIDRPQTLLKQENAELKTKLEERGMLYLTKLTQLPEILGIPSTVYS